MATHAPWVVTALLTGLLLDQLGEPPPGAHPVVWMGCLLNRLGAGLPALDPGRALIAGTLCWTMGAILVGGLAYGAQLALVGMIQPRLSAWRALSAGLMIGILLKPLFAWRLLREEVAAVEVALARGLVHGRRRVARIASRATGALCEIELRETAIESLAENLNDSVVAPLLWFAIAGLPGAALYRFANTADAMWGYRGRWEWAGKCAAKIDDVLSWVPARITAAALVPPRRWRDLAGEARRTPSPNSGWPMSAMALRLGVRLGKPGVYVLNPGGRSADSSDVEYALRSATMALGWLAPAVLGLAWHSPH